MRNSLSQFYERFLFKNFKNRYIINSSYKVRYFKFWLGELGLVLFSPKPLLTVELMFGIVVISLLDFVWYIGGIEMNDKEEKEEKEFYKEKIVEMVKKIDRLDMLEYLYLFIKDKFKVG